MSVFKKLAVAALLAPAMASAEPYLIAGVGTGTTEMGWVQNAFDAGAKSDEDLQRAIIGMGFRVNRNLAVEAAYLSRADSSVEGTVTVPGYPTVPARVDLDHQGVQAALVALAPLTPQFSVFGKLTANVLAITMDTSVAGISALSDSDTDISVGAGLGAQFQINDTVGLRLGVERTMVKEFADYSDGDFDIDQASLTLMFGI